MKIKNQIPLKIRLAAVALAFAAVATSLHAQLTIPNADGSDGALIISGNTVIDLSKAGAGSWTNTSASLGNGTYDPVQWAVVFKYSSVVISNGATLSFLNNATHAPVVWLVSGSVTINGNLSLNGQSGSSDPNNLPEPGPGGFRGGGFNFGNGPGFGPGGGSGAATYSGTYGNLQILPLVGGSGGGGNGLSGGAGGGAILIAAAQNITINGSCTANGGSGYYVNGSGGAIRLVANQLSVTNGSISAQGGQGNGASGIGRIRLEANGSSFSGSYTINPSVPVVSPTPLQIFPDSTAPTATIISVVTQSGQTNTVPSDPKAAMSLAANGDDLTLITTNNVTIRVSTTNFPTNGTVNVFIKPRNANQTTLTAAYVSGDSNSAIWQVSAFLNYQPNQGHTVIQARAFH